MNAAELLLSGQPDAVALIEGTRQVRYRELRFAVRQSAAAWRLVGLQLATLALLLCWTESTLSSRCWA